MVAEGGGMDMEMEAEEGRMGGEEVEVCHHYHNSQIRWECNKLCLSNKSNNNSHRIYHHNCL